MSGQATIPLTCNICAKKPDFSDVSHLLTHIASKGHLSSYFKMKVNGTRDAECQRLVEEYDEWYAEWSLDDLMRERMSQKDKRSGRGGTTTAARRSSAGQSRKNTRSSAKANRNRRSATNTSFRSTPSVAMNARQPTRQLRDSVLNPRLNPRNARGEPLSRSATPVSAVSFNGQVPNGRYAPPMQSWPTTPYAGSPVVKQESVGSSWSADSFEVDAESEFMAPAYGGGRRRIVDEEESVVAEDLWEMDETISDATKLKGVTWPGMAMFDSATPEMKRKRNQRKDYSVIEQLKATSEYVEPNEMIFDIDGNLRKQRVITGDPNGEDDESILSGETTPEPELPKKRPARRPRPALVEKNVNTGRILRQRSSYHPPYGNNKRRAPYYDGEDEDLTYGQPRPKKRTGLSIHRDNTGPDITFNEPAPYQLNYLSTGFRNAYQSSRNHSQMHNTQPTFTQSNYGHSNHQRLPSFPFADTFGSNFRPASTSSTLPTSNSASFGGLNTSTLFQNGPWQSHNNHGGQSALSLFTQQYGLPSQQQQQQQQQNPFGSSNNMFQNHIPNQHSHHNDNWDFFAAFNQQTGGLADLGSNFQAGTELNPLFFSSNQPTPPDDDEATVSPPASGRVSPVHR